LRVMGMGTEVYHQGGLSSQTVSMTFPRKLFSQCVNI
jgi:hypothetical protein